MNEFKGTPGPWAAGESADGEYLVWAETDTNTALAAVMPCERAYCISRLIAAAPDLLEALMLARTHVENDLLDIIDAAIAKALGGKQEVTK